jgi:hypothetical protein
MFFPAEKIVALIILAAADPVPDFNVEPHCREVAARAAPVGDAAVCLRAEGEARAALARQWAQFAADDKAHCLRLATLGGVPTYSALLTCLELERDARALRGNTEPKAAGQGR